MEEQKPRRNRIVIQHPTQSFALRSDARLADVFARRGWMVRPASAARDRNIPDFETYLDHKTGKPDLDRLRSDMTDRLVQVGRRFCLGNLPVESGANGLPQIRITPERQWQVQREQLRQDKRLLTSGDAYRWDVFGVAAVDRTKKDWVMTVGERLGKCVLPARDGLAHAVFALATYGLLSYPEIAEHGASQTRKGIAVMRLVSCQPVFLLYRAKA